MTIESAIKILSRFGSSVKKVESTDGGQAAVLLFSNGNQVNLEFHDDGELWLTSIANRSVFVKDLTGMDHKDIEQILTKEGYRVLPK